MDFTVESIFTNFLRVLSMLLATKSILFYFSKFLTDFNPIMPRTKGQKLYIMIFSNIFFNLSLYRFGHEKDYEFRGSLLKIYTSFQFS